MSNQTDNFEWDFSKENITPLSTGRSVDQLNKVLCSRNTHLFKKWCSKIREHFEQGLIRCPSDRRLQLYTRYIRWIDETYPALGASSELQEILYRCVRDTCGLDGIHNDPNYVQVWLRLVNYCEAPSELFNLLFHNGVGTLCASFYLAWVDHVQQFSSAARSETTGSPKWAARVAAILVHGLRAGAQPMAFLEDRAESLLESIRQSEEAEEAEHALESLFDNQCKVQKNSVESRKTLATLFTVETNAGGQRSTSAVPSIRSRAAIDPDNRGLRDLAEKQQEIRRRPQKPPAGLQVLRDDDSPKDLQTHLPVVRSGTRNDLGKSLSRLAEPVANWDLENHKKPIAKLDRNTALRIGPVSAQSPVDAPRPREALIVYRDTSQSTDTPIESSVEVGASLPVLRSRGLQMKPPLTAPTTEASHSTSTGLSLFSLDTLRAAILHLQQQPAATNAVDEGLHFCTTSADSNVPPFHLDPDPITTSPPRQASFSLFLDDEHSRALLEEIAELVSPEGGLHVSQTTPRKEVMATRVARNDYREIIQRLDDIVTRFNSPSLDN